MEASRRGYSEGAAEAIAHAFTDGGSVGIVYARALDSYPGCCEQCTAIVPLLTRKHISRGRAVRSVSGRVVAVPPCAMRAARCGGPSSRHATPLQHAVVAAARALSL
jgi:hypothetical protein